MPMLLFDPLVLGLLLGLIVYVWVVWRGSFRRWLGRDDGWTAVAWPFPLVLLVVPLIGGLPIGGLGLLGVEVAEGGTLGAAVYALVYAVPLVALSVWPPRWLLPAWARQRLSVPPPPGPDGPSDAVPALHGVAGHGSRARWAWRVDAVPGRVWVEGEVLRFRRLGGQTPAQMAGGQLPELEDDARPRLRPGDEGDLRVESPRGGHWGRHQLDVEVRGVDRWRVQARRPWRRDGLVTFEVEGRGSVALWVADVRAVASRLTALGD